MVLQPAHQVGGLPAGSGRQVQDQRRLLVQLEKLHRQHRGGFLDEIAAQPVLDGLAQALALAFDLPAGLAKGDRADLPVITPGQLLNGSFRVGLKGVNAYRSHNTSL